MQLKPLTGVEKMITQAKALERDKDLEAAGKLYQSALKADPLNEKALTRMMIIARRKKDAKSELKLINQLIKIHQSYYRPKAGIGNSVQALSKKLNIALGRTDKKGNELVIPDAIKKLEKRKERLLDKLKK